ncbi:hypothetical protein OSTOST_10920 [Ostertagia ostertagi]
MASPADATTTIATRSPIALCASPGRDCRCTHSSALFNATVLGESSEKPKHTYSSTLRISGRRCVEAINERSIKGLNDCSEFALCEDAPAFVDRTAKEGYVCSCRNGYVDASPNATHYPGRVCRKPIERLTVTEFTSSFSHDSCDPKKPRCGTNEICTDRGQRGHHSCQCADNAFRYEDGTCRGGPLF